MYEIFVNFVEKLINSLISVKLAQVLCILALNFVHAHFETSKFPKHHYIIHPHLKCVS
jgi:hypothetical protein